MRGRMVLAGLVVAGSLGAGAAPDEVTSSDPCGDLAAARVGAHHLEAQPEEWDRADIAALTVREVLAADGTVDGVDLVVEFCGDVRAPRDPGESVEVTWRLPDEDCRASVAHGSVVNQTVVSGNVGVVIGPGSPRFAVRCVDQRSPGDLVTTASDREVVALSPAAVAREGRVLTFALRVEELGPLGTLVDDGATIAATGVSRALYGTSWFGDLGEVAWTGGTTDWIGVIAPLTLGD
ncbi:MAG: hypothetical protein KY461_15640 [Actinobacteria bacterium]|nr:hypothetical protein [Actinomycetota bacterium]